MDEHQTMRENVANEYGFSLYRLYAEPQAAAYLSVDLSTLMRWRRKGLTEHVGMGPRKIRYMGIHIADLLLGGVKDE